MSDRPCSICQRNPVMDDESPLCALCYVKNEEAADEGHRIAVARGLAPPTLTDLLGDVRAFVGGFVVLGTAELVAVALWIIHVYTFQAAETTPYLAVTSATKRSGKSRLLEVIEAVLGPERSLFTANITPAALYRVVDANTGMALLMDEFDRLANRERAEELAGLVNSGFRRRGGMAYRVQGKSADLRPVAFATFAPKALAGIGNLPDTVADRSIPVRMRPKLASEHVSRFRERDAAAAEPLRVSLATWASEEVIGSLRGARPDLPTQLNDRAQDAWEPLLAIADLAGEEWPASARSAAIDLHGRVGEVPDESVALLALEHVREAFGESDRIPTAELVGSLVERDDGPWSEWWGEHLDRGRAQAAAQRLGRLLGPFGVRPHKIRLGDRTMRGYERADFADAWARHLPPGGDPENAGTSGTGGTVQAAPTSVVPGVPGVPPFSGSWKLPPEDREVIEYQRRFGREDGTAAALLESRNSPPPPGFGRWNRLAVQAAMGEVQ